MTTNHTLAFTAAEVDERLVKAGNALLKTSQELTEKEKIQVKTNLGISDCPDQLKLLGAWNYGNFTLENNFKSKFDFSSLFHPNLVANYGSFSTDSHYGPNEMGNYYDLTAYKSITTTQSFKININTLHSKSFLRSENHSDLYSILTIEFGLKSGDFVDFLFEGIDQGIDHFITNHYNQTEMEIDAIRIIIGSGGKANLQFYNSFKGTVELTVDVPRWTIIGVSLDLIPDLLA